MINKLLNKVILIFAITVFLIPAVHAQQPEAHHDKAKKYRLAYELFVKEKYSASREMFHEFLNEPGTAVNDRINAEYYMATKDDKWPILIDELQKMLDSYQGLSKTTNVV